MNEHPVIAGFHPDPTICRVGDDYWLATSSFEYVPGVPVFHSRDLVHWEQVGNALERPTQLPTAGLVSNRGVYAPTLRHHDGRFWLITTDVSAGDGLGHLIVTTTDPRQGWSDPVRTPGLLGIDPDLAWDEDGRCYLTWAAYADGASRILQVELDTTTGASLTEPRSLWSGTGLASPEAPHLYRVGDWWYLLIAEGGTERGHCASVARSRHVTGPFEGAPTNPVLTHRSTGWPVQSTGHADMVELADGSWAAVHLGVRTAGWTPLYHVNGRETFLTGIDWVDGWPVFVEDRFTVEPQDHSFVETFPAGPLHPRWVCPGAHPDSFTSREGDGPLLLHAAAEPGPEPRLLSVRARDPRWHVQAVLDVSAGTARLVVRVDSRHWYALEADPTGVRVRVQVGPFEQVVHEVAAPGEDRVVLHVRSTDPSDGPQGFPEGPDDIELGVDGPDGYVRLAALDGRYLSTEVAGGFTGRVVGVLPVAGTVGLHEVRYTTVA
ncbi:family 43 glycosylhydrolase [Cellulomonas soli]|uniref:glycoside hydrolase family 43 protein n=1 Tax=Cellulomonas soli TaxID=931535 RepID=UPI003F8390C4